MAMDERPTLGLPRGTRATDEGSKAMLRVEGLAARVDGPRVRYCLNRRALERFKALVNGLAMPAALAGNQHG